MVLPLESIAKRPKLEAPSEEDDKLLEVKKLYTEQMYLKVDPFFSKSKHIGPEVLKEMHSSAVKSVFDKIQNSKLQVIPTDKLLSAMNAAFQAIHTENCTLFPNNNAIGIDLGTTYSCVAVYEQGRVQIIPNRNTGKMTTCSYVKFDKDRQGNVLTEVGDFVKSNADDSPDTIYDAKRIIGRRFNDPDLQKDMKLWSFVVVESGGVPKISSKGEVFHPEEISAMILKEMKQSAEIFLGTEVTKAVITVPAYFTDGQRQATVDAGELAGLQVLQIINEPTAAALAYRLERKDLSPRHVLVFDFGGGTLDCSVLRMEDGKIDVLAVGGDTHLGGEDIDHNMVLHCIKHYNNLQKPIFRLNIGQKYNDKVSRQKYARRLRVLRNDCEEKKKALSHATKVDVYVKHIYRLKDLNVPITRKEFEEMNMDLFKKAIGIVKDVIAKANVKKEDIEDIVLVGGSTRIPKVQEMLRELFGPNKRIVSRINPDEAVAHGAAIQAAIVNGHIEMGSPDYITVRDVTPYSLGIQARGKDQKNLKFSVIIPKNTPVPVSISKNSFRTTNDNQTSAAIKIYQGESEKIEESTLLGHFSLTIPPQKAGQERVMITMNVDAQGILQIKATCLSTGEVNEIAIEANKMRLSKEEIQKIKEEGSHYK